MSRLTKGKNYDQGVGGKLPAKEPGKHRWIVIASYALNDRQVQNAVIGNRVNLDNSNRIGLQSGCLDCEQPYDLARGTKCDAEGFAWNDESGE